MSNVEGVIFSIQRFSIQDGPGIRSTVFLKGCPLSCKWCSNPESQKLAPELMFRSQNCERCFSCVEVCEQNAISVVEEQTSIDRDLCNDCLNCVDVCCSGALEATGERMSLEEVVDEVCRDELFYKNSGGGVTLSGGEPLLQAGFALELLKQLKERSIDTTIDTCGHVASTVFESILPYVNRFLFDVKHLDPRLHEKETGVDNQLILDNLEQLQASNTEIWIRVPVISGFNNNQEFFQKLDKLLTGKKIEKVSLLAYHKWGTPKYQFMGREYPWSNADTCSEEELEDYKRFLESGGLNVTIGF